MANSIFQGTGWGWISIGDPIWWGNPNLILFGDGSSNVAQNDNLYFEQNDIVFQVWDRAGIINNTRFTVDVDSNIINNETTGSWVVRNGADWADLFWYVHIPSRFVSWWDINGEWNQTYYANDDTNREFYSVGKEIQIVAWPIDFSHAPSSDQIWRTTWFTWITTTTYTITVAASWTEFDWTDGTNSGTNVPMDIPNQVLLSNWISVYFIEFGTYTPWDYYTFTFTVSDILVQWLLLDYNNAAYEIWDTTNARSKAKFIVNNITWALSAITDSSLSVRNTAWTNTIFAAWWSSVSFWVTTGIWYTFQSFSDYSTNDYIISDASITNIWFFAVRDGNYNSSWRLRIDPTYWEYYFWDLYNNNTQIHISDTSGELNLKGIGAVKIWDTTLSANQTLFTVNDNLKYTINSAQWAGLGYGVYQFVNESSSSESGILLKNTGTNWYNYGLFSSNDSSGVWPFKFVIADTTNAYSFFTYDGSNKDLQIGSGTDAIFDFGIGSKYMNFSLWTGMYIYGIYNPWSWQYMAMRWGNNVGSWLLDDDNQQVRAQNWSNIPFLIDYLSNTTYLNADKVNDTSGNARIDFTSNFYYDSFANIWGNFSESNTRRLYTASWPEAFNWSNTQVQSTIDFRTAEWLEMAKRWKRIYVTQTSSFTASDRNLYYVDASWWSITITLPTAVWIQYQIYSFKRIDNSWNTVTFASTSSQTIDTASAGSTTLSPQAKINLQSDNANRFSI